MKRLLLQTLFIVAPIFVGFFANRYFGVMDQGDLLRIGYMANAYPKYRDQFKPYFTLDTVYQDLSRFRDQKSKNKRILTLGDSFSQQGTFGFQNFLAIKHGYTVIHYNKQGNQIEDVYGLINGRVLEKIKPDYVVIQIVERGFTILSKNCNKKARTTMKQAEELDRAGKQKLMKERKFYETPPTFFADATVKFPLFNSLYLIDDNAIWSQTYRVKVNEDFFSVGDKELLFFGKDLVNLNKNNDLGHLRGCNNLLNELATKLKAKGIELLVFVSPDKFDFYYEFMTNKSKYPEPLFFKQFEKLEKEYLYLNTKEVLRKDIHKTKDLYFYDDTHWSPKAARRVAEEISKLID